MFGPLTSLLALYDNCLQILADLLQIVADLSRLVALFNRRLGAMFCNVRFKGRCQKYGTTLKMLPGGLEASAFSGTRLWSSLCDICHSFSLPLGLLGIPCWCPLDFEGGPQIASFSNKINIKYEMGCPGRHLEKS